jgi:hypothetical protein
MLRIRAVDEINRTGLLSYEVTYCDKIYLQILRLIIRQIK